MLQHPSLLQAWTDQIVDIHPIISIRSPLLHPIDQVRKQSRHPTLRLHLHLSLRLFRFIITPNRVLSHNHIVLRDGSVLRRAGGIRQLLLRDGDRALCSIRRRRRLRRTHATPADVARIIDRGVLRALVELPLGRGAWRGGAFKLRICNLDVERKLGAEGEVVGTDEVRKRLGQGTLGLGHGFFARVDHGAGFAVSVCG